MSKIAVMADKETGLIFKNLGIDVLESPTVEEASRVLREKAGEYGIIFITEDLALKMRTIIEEYQSQSLPAIIEIPSFEGSRGLGRMKMKRICERAIGADILFKED